MPTIRLMLTLHDDNEPQNIQYGKELLVCPTEENMSINTIEKCNLGDFLKLIVNICHQFNMEVLRCRGDSACQEAEGENE